MRRLAVAAAALWLLAGCSGPALEPWHTARLTQEFTADKAVEVRTFADYLELEDRLFAQLLEEVYARVETGPGYELVRYSTGSAADPEQRTPNWNRSFELRPPKPRGGVLLLHGMSDAPYSLRALGETLQREGYRVVGLRLPGHGTAPSGLRRASARDMAAAVRLGMAHLASTLGEMPIHMVGYSAGAALAMGYALDAADGAVEPAPASLVLVSPAIRIHAAAALARFKDALSVVPGLGGLAWLSILPEFDPYKYNSFPTNAGDVVHQLTRAVDRRVAAHAAARSAPPLPPILVLKSTVDATVTTEAVVERLLALLAPRRNELVLFDINRFAAKSTLLISEPGPLTDRLMADGSLPFALTLVANAGPGTLDVVLRRKPPLSARVTDEPLDLAWPRGVLSLSHVAVPFPPDDPLYGREPPANEDALFLGDTALRGERGLLKLPGDWLLRMRWNPFYAVLERRVLAWLAGSPPTGRQGAWRPAGVQPAGHPGGPERPPARAH